ncbi:MAG TPA: hypothetical protein VJ063_13240 [Verrucomicrobiae bacterium]|nr:hypothetical protein [Verrucomicrobiae bacterium]
MIYILLIAALYSNGFDKAEPGKVPDELMVLEGGFNVQEEGGNKFLELPGAPLETFGLLFGPTEAENISATARFYGTGKGRRFPTFALGVNGVSGYKLQMSPGKKALELVKGENEVLATVPYTWESGTWTTLRLQVRKASDGQWQIEGKAWKQGAAEPGKWMITHSEKTAPMAGRAGVWGMPYAGTPIRFDDLTVAKVE